jgi:hypothetical protein
MAMASTKTDPTEIAGWGIARNRDGEYIAFKTIDGKARFVRLGRTLDGSEERLHTAMLRYSSPTGGMAG